MLSVLPLVVKSLRLRHGTRPLDNLNCSIPQSSVSFRADQRLRFLRILEEHSIFETNRDGSTTHAGKVGAAGDSRAARAGRRAHAARSAQSLASRRSGRAGLTRCRPPSEFRCSAHPAETGRRDDRIPRSRHPAIGLDHVLGGRVQVRLERDGPRRSDGPARRDARGAVRAVHQPARPRRAPGRPGAARISRVTASAG